MHSFITVRPSSSLHYITTSRLTRWLYNSVSISVEWRWTSACAIVRDRDQGHHHHWRGYGMNTSPLCLSPRAHLTHCTPLGGDFWIWRGRPHRDRAPLTKMPTAVSPLLQTHLQPMTRGIQVTKFLNTKNLKIRFNSLHFKKIFVYLR